MFPFPRFPAPFHGFYSGFGLYVPTLKRTLTKSSKPCYLVGPFGPAYSPETYIRYISLVSIFETILFRHLSRMPFPLRTFISTPLAHLCNVFLSLCPFVLSVSPFHLTSPSSHLI